MFYVNSILKQALLFILFGSMTRLWSQHCQYDFVKLIGLVPFSGDTQNVVKGLEIKVAFHTTDKPLDPRLIFDSQYKYPSENKYTNKVIGGFVRFTLQQNGQNFPFTQNYYTGMFNVGQKDPSKFYIMIRDTDGELNGGFFGTRIIEIESKKRQDGYDTVYMMNRLKQMDSFDVRLGKYPYVILCGTHPETNTTMSSYEPIFINLLDRLETFDTAENKEFADIQFEKWKGNHGIWEIISRQNSMQLESNFYNWYVDSSSNKKEWRCVKSNLCWHVFPHSERVDCVTQEFKNNQWIQTHAIHGCE